MVLNALLFLPFGYLYVRRLRGRRRAMLRASAVAFVLSAGVEFLQVFMHNHFATVTDVIMDVSGAAIGAWIGRMERATGIEPV